MNAFVAVTNSADCVSRYARYWSTAALPSADNFVAAVPVTTSLPLLCFEPPGHAVAYVPGFSVSENSLLRPGATFSTSPMMRSPESTSNSLTSPEPVLLTLKFVGPAVMVSLAGQPSSLISTFTVAVLAPDSPTSSVALNSGATQGHDEPCTGGGATDPAEHGARSSWGDGSDGFDGA